MILGTHDTMSGHKPYHWYMYPLWIFGKCQKYDIYTQIVMGCEVYDLRVRWHKGRGFRFQHGIIEFEHDLSAFDTLVYLNSSAKMYNTTFYIRFWNESVKELSETEKDEWEKLCKKITDYNFSNLKIAFGLKSNWRQCVENYKSWGGGMYMQEVNEVMNPWYKIFLTPKYYADKYTEERLKKLVGTKDLVIGDYINKDLISKYGS